MITIILIVAIMNGLEAGTINRLNYGAYLQEITKTSVQTAHWSHTFKIALPGFEFGENYDYITASANVTESEKNCATKAAESLLRSRETPTTESMRTWRKVHRLRC